ncbi:hypothetical protein FRC03_002604 [Tulasnella sp. 419]|nr:hypothetical protein FRC02_012384 [Tulasnella sp. 418]KAG8943179.1 hypothetical protein FRC03_002604 [Tulasnella sp. 419]
MPGPPEPPSATRFTVHILPTQIINTRQQFNVMPKRSPIEKALPPLCNALLPSRSLCQAVKRWHDNATELEDLFNQLHHLTDAVLWSFESAPPSHALEERIDRLVTELTRIAESARILYHKGAASRLLLQSKDAAAIASLRHSFMEAFRTFDSWSHEEVRRSADTPRIDQKH